MGSDFGSNLAKFLCAATIDFELPPGFNALVPYSDAEVRRVVNEFCSRYYAGSQKRLALWGINPGRFGAGITGICFTDPLSLTGQLEIPSTLTGRRELSAEFISMVIDEYGGPTAFYRDVYLGALSPIGFVREGKNINFYDDKTLANTIVPFIRYNLQTITSFGLQSKAAILLGSGSLQAYVQKYLSDHFTEMKVLALDHPRFIMQYKRSSVRDYVKRYVDSIAVYLQFR